MILAGQWEPTPPRAGSLDDTMARGFDTDSAHHDRTPVETDPELLAALRDQAHGIREMRDEDAAWRLHEAEGCGDHTTRCDRCDERMCAIDGPEPRACATTCVDCPCDCQTCVHIRDDLRAELVRQIARDSA